MFEYVYNYYVHASTKETNYLVPHGSRFGKNGYEWYKIRT